MSVFEISKLRILKHSSAGYNYFMALQNGLSTAKTVKHDDYYK
jgi:hypothetical protein